MNPAPVIPAMSIPNGESDIISVPRGRENPRTGPAGEMTAVRQKLERQF